MKKVLFAIILLILLSTSIAFASDELTSSPSANVQKKVSYDLPYPGILPDNPLYTLKTARDKLVAFLINDPLKKAEFDLLASDKRLNAALFLAEKNKDALAVSTVSKSNNYLHEGISRLYDAERMQKDVMPLSQRISSSLEKREEVIKMMEKGIDSKYKKELLMEYKKISGLQLYLSGVGKK